MSDIRIPRELAEKCLADLNEYFGSIGGHIQEGTFKRMQKHLHAQLTPPPCVGDVRVKQRAIYIKDCEDQDDNLWVLLRVGGQMNPGRLATENLADCPTLFNIYGHLKALEAGPCVYLTEEEADKLFKNIQCAEHASALDKLFIALADWRKEQER